MGHLETLSVGLRQLEIIQHELTALQARCSQLVKDGAMSGRAASEIVRNLGVRNSTLLIVQEAFESLRLPLSTIAAVQAVAEREGS